MRLEDYEVSEEFGFVLPNPLERLPSYFKAWNELAKEAPDLTIAKEFRKKVDCMLLLDHTRLSTHEEKRLAHLQLCIIATCYVWQDGDKGVSKVLPRCIAVPLFSISDDLGIQPIISHVSIALANWKLKDKSGPRQLPNIRTLHMVPGGNEADWFMAVTVRIELDFAPAVKAVIDAVSAAEEGDNQFLISSCICIHNCLRKMKETLSRMHENLSAETFYNTLRPFLSGYGGKNSPLPDGLIYEGVSESPKTMIGGSAAQSSTLQCFDVAFGVKHAPDIQRFLRAMRLHMPRRHREFIEDIHERSSIRQYVTESANEDLIQAYNNCIQAAADFRSYHIQIITKYIVIMAKKRSKDHQYDAVAEQGTGGSSLTPFLKSIRDKTLAKLIHISS